LEFKTSQPADLLKNIMNNSPAEKPAVFIVEFQRKEFYPEDKRVRYLPNKNSISNFDIFGTTKSFTRFGRKLNEKKFLQKHFRLGF
jgi:hypothetical protein